MYNNGQLLDEVGQVYAEFFDRGQCYLPKAEA
jgi:hypothetical protein